MAGGGAGYGTNTTGEGPASPYGATAPDSTMSDNFGGSVSSTPTNQYAVEDRAAAINRAYQFSLGRAPEQGGYDFWTDTGNRLNWSPAQAANAVNTAGAPERAQQQADIYANLTQPSGDVLDTIYRQSLGRAPEAAGANFWANEAQRYGWTGQQLAENINLAGAPERAQSGFQSQLIPQNYTAQRVGTTPSYYNTNPVAVDYANIFNPRAGQVAFDRATLSPQQQAQYLQGWQTDYSNRLQRGVADARAQRVATAQKAQSDYNTKKAQAEAQAAASNQEAINRAVQEALAQQQSYGSDNNGYGFYTGAAGGIASLAKGFKK